MKSRGSRDRETRKDSKKSRIRSKRRFFFNTLRSKNRTTSTQESNFPGRFPRRRARHGGLKGDTLRACTSARVPLSSLSSSEWPRREGLLRVRWHRERNRVVESLFLSASNRKRDSRHRRRAGRRVDQGNLEKYACIYIYIWRT